MRGRLALLGKSRRECEVISRQTVSGHFEGRCQLWGPRGDPGTDPPSGNSACHQERSLKLDPAHSKAQQAFTRCRMGG